MDLQITALLNLAPANDEIADRLFRAVESQLRTIAQKKLGRERDANSIQGTMLVDDAFQILLKAGAADWESRAQYYGAAAKVMRRLLVDHARKRKAQRRAAVTEPLDDQNPPTATSWENPADILAIDELIANLERDHDEAFRVFHLHYFLGCSLKEIASDILDIPYIRAKRLWGIARAYLRRELVGAQSDDQ